MRGLWNIFDKLLRLCAAASGAVICAIVVGITVNVVLRNAFGTPIYGLLELVEYGLLLVALLGAPWVLSKHAHVTVDILSTALPLPVRNIHTRALTTLGFVVSLVICWFAFEAAQASLQRGSMIRASFTFPEWWVLSVMPVSFLLLALEFARQFLVKPDAHLNQAGL